jgi:predicted Zn finger-like uncharacterized protein
MTIPVECGECGASYKVKDDKAGTRIKCPKCSAVIKVPSGDDDDEFVEPTPSKRKTAPKGSSRKGAKKGGAKSGGGSNQTALIAGAAVFGVLVVGGIAFWMMSGRKRRSRECYSESDPGRDFHQLHELRQRGAN